MNVHASNIDNDRLNCIIYFIFNYIKLYEINYIIKVMLCNIKLLSYNQNPAETVLGHEMKLQFMVGANMETRRIRAKSNCPSFSQLHVAACAAHMRSSQVDRAMGMNDIHGCVPL